MSLVVCTYNRANSLGGCLDAITKIRPPAGVNFEFILVDNGSTDHTRAVFEEWQASCPFPAHRIFEIAKGVGNGLNRGYRNSHGAIVAFTDDDCYPDPGFASTVLAAFQDPAVGVVTGRILLFDPDDAPLTIETSQVAQIFPAGKYVRPGQFTGANLSFRREALDAIGGFDPLFGPGSYIGSGADCDAASRVCRAGWDGKYDPCIVVHHHHGRKEADSAALHRRYAIGSGGYHMKLLLEGRQSRHFMRYIGGLPKKLLRHPATLLWEAIGAARFLKHPPRWTVRPRIRAVDRRREDEPSEPQNDVQRRPRKRAGE